MLSNYYYVPELTAFTLFYTVCGIVLKEKAPSPGKIKEITPYFYYMYYTNLVSLIHCLLGIILPLIVFWINGFEMNRESIYLHHLVMCNSNAYFFYDLVMELYYGILDMNTAIHHICVFTLGSYYFWNPYGGDEYLMTLVLGEFANPCLIMRTIYKSMRKTHTKEYTYIEAAFAVLFLFIRVLIYPFWMQAVLECEN